MLNEKKLLKFPAELISHKTYATKQNISLVFELQENLVPDELAQLLGAKGKTGHLVFNPTLDGALTIEDIPMSAVEPGTKSPSKRLRNTLFRLWEHKKSQGEDVGSSDAFYLNQMEKFIDHVKQHLPPREL